MKEIAEEQEFLKKPKWYLISSYLGKNLYLGLGLKVTKIFEFVHFHPLKCFSNLANEIAKNRLAGDSNPGFKNNSMIYELLGKFVKQLTLCETPLADYTYLEEGHGADQKNYGRKLSMRI